MQGANNSKRTSNDSQQSMVGGDEKLQNNGAKKVGSQENKKGAAAELKAMLAKFKVWISGAESKKAVRESLSTSKQLKGRNTGEATKNIRKEYPNKLLIRYQQEDTALTGSQKQSQSVATPEDSPPPYSVRDPLIAINDSAEEMEALLDALDGLPNQAPDKPATTFKNEKSKNADNLLYESLQTLTDSPPPYSLHDPLATQEGPLPPSYIATPPTPEQLNGPKPMSAKSLLNAINNGLTQALQSKHGSLIDTSDIQKFKENLSISLGLNQGKLSFDQYSALGVMKSEIEPFLQADVKSNFDALMHRLEDQLMKDLGTT